MALSGKIVVMEKPAKTKQKIVEEILNSVAHGLGALGAIAGLVLGIIFINSSSIFKTGFIIYGASLTLLLLMSTLYHALTFTRAFKVFRSLDHGSIFILIAGTYTPFVIYLYNGFWQYFLLSLVWSMAFAGIALSAVLILPKSMNVTNVLLYLAFGWLAIVFTPKIGLLSLPVIWLLVTGGLLYTLGVIPFALKKPFAHFSWHIFVLAAASAHFLAIVQMV